MNHATLAPTLSATRQPARIRRALRLAVRAVRSEHVVDATGVYTGRNQPAAYRLALATRALEEAVEALHGAELAAYERAVTCVRAQRHVETTSRASAFAKKLRREPANNGFRAWLRKVFLAPKPVGNTMAERLLNALRATGGV